MKIKAIVDITGVKFTPTKLGYSVEQVSGESKSYNSYEFQGECGFKGVINYFKYYSDRVGRIVYDKPINKEDWL